MASIKRCELCRREQSVTFHHLIPKAVHRRQRIRQRYTIQELRSRGIYICRLCHSGIHDLISAKDSAESFMTKKALLAHPAVARHIAWVKKQK